MMEVFINLNDGLKEFLAYGFVCIHRRNSMIKNVNGVCRHIDPLIHRYLVDATIMRFKDITLRPFSYNFNVFSQYPNPRHVPQHDVLTAIETVSRFLPPLSFIIIQFGSIPPCSQYRHKHIFHL